MQRRSEPVETLLDLAAPEAEWMESPVRTAVLNLPGKYREMILLYYDQGMNLSEIAQMLHLSQNTVSTRLRRARKKLEEALKGEVEL